MKTTKNPMHQGARRTGGFIRIAGVIYVAATLSAVLYELTRGHA